MDGTEEKTCCICGKKFTGWGNDPQQFQSYFRQHYAPLLNKIADSPYNKIDLTDKDKRLVRLMRDDLLKIFQAE